MATLEYALYYSAGLYTSVKEHKLISQSAGQVKVLARGVLNKKLHLKLQDYSLEAAKMVIATGGSVKRC